MTTVLEVGPGTVRLLGRGTHCATVVYPDAGAAALGAGDDPTALFGDTPVATRSLWRSVLEPLLAGSSAVLLVHPSWWTADRVGLVADVAGCVAAPVRTVARAELLHPNQVFVEIGPESAVIGDRTGITGAETRCAEAAVVVDRLAHRLADGLVHIDAPVGVPGADALAAQLARRLRKDGRPVRVLTDRHLKIAAASAALEPAPPPRRSRPWIRALAAAIALVTVAGLAIRYGESPRRTTDLVDGRMTVRVPADWVVRRVIDGPGSARVEVAAPDDPSAVLYLTQSPAGEPDLGDAAAVLRTALAQQPPGVFIDFTAAEVRSGRPAITYREIRPGREIAWTVVLSGRIRIAIGCQDVPAACAEAIESAREIG